MKCSKRTEPLCCDLQSVICHMESRARSATERLYRNFQCRQPSQWP